MTQGFIVASLAVFFGTLVVTAIFGWWKGGKPERLGILVIVAMGLAQFGLHQVFPPTFWSVDPAALASDLLGFAAFTWIAYHARRYWPLCAAALQLLSLAGHFAREVERQVDPWAYSLMKTTPTFLVCLTIFAGTSCHWRRARRRQRELSSRG